MATLSQWVEGARPRTLPAAIAPVVAGTGVAAAVNSVVWPRALLALLVALALQVGVNFANDYSDGIRGTDKERIGPFRLVGSGAANPARVKAAAWASFGVAALAGLVLVALTGVWWLLLLGGLAILAAWFYTGGNRPYGYRALGELSVFVFFGLLAVIGTAYVQILQVTPSAIVAGVAIGALASAILVANNLRDLPTDAAAGKRTLAVLLGQRRTRGLFAILMAVPYVLAIWLAIAGRPGTWLAVVSVPLAARAVRPVLRRAEGRALIQVLRDTGLTDLAYALLLAIGLWLSSG